jgi:uncharacterized protein (TIGR03032 family)
MTNGVDSPHWSLVIGHPLLGAYNAAMSRPADEPASELAPEPTDAAKPSADQPPPLRSVHTSNLPQILAEGRFSLLVTTYQAGKLVLLRNDNGVLNTHFRNFLKPMGLAVQGGKLAIGCNIDIWEFHNVPAVCPKLSELDEYKDTPFNHDACYLPRRSHTTGDVQIHEMAWVGEELWFVNTAFSCLATRSDCNSFEPRWRPSFVTDLGPGDKCHLNGLASRDGRVRYVTALGETNTPGGWRENKRDGGLLIDVESQEIITRGLSMPHSPRWYRDKLWILESGNGGFGTIDLVTGKYQEIVQMPGFTRGLSFLGPLAFVGLSQVRESAVFSGIPLVERLEERTCGVWVLNIETGQTVAFCKFEDAVQEIFAVEALVGCLFPDLINHDAELIGRSYVLADEALADVPAELRASEKRG